MEYMIKEREEKNDIFSLWIWHELTALLCLKGIARDRKDKMCTNDKLHHIGIKGFSVYGTLIEKYQ